MKVTVLEGANAEEVIARSGVNKDFGQTGPDEDLTRVVTGRRKDGKTGPAKLISLNMVGAMLDAENPRSLGLDLYETYGFQIEQMSPLALDQQEWSYSGCSECNKKAGTCQHKGEPIPRFSMQAKLSDPTGCLMVKVFSNGVEGILNSTTAGKVLNRSEEGREYGKKVLAEITAIAQEESATMRASEEADDEGESGGRSHVPQAMDTLVSDQKESDGFASWAK
jgi:hypothetical protein